MFSALYSFILLFVYLIFFPLLLVRGKFRGRTKRYWLNLIGYGLPLLDSKRELVWIHAVSVGEIAAVENFVRQLKAKHPEVQVLTSHITPTGFRRGSKIPGIDAQIYLPLDFGFIVKRVLKFYNPKSIFVVETDHWFHFLSLGKKLGAKVALINGKMSDRSLKKYQLFSYLTKKLFGLYDHLFVQNQHYADSFKKLGFTDTSITGNLKLDNLKQIASSNFKAELSNEKVRLVLGSTHPGEEELLIKAIKPLFKEISNLQILVVPRHPERFDAVYLQLQQEFEEVCRFTEDGFESKAPVLLVDVMGRLLDCYRLSQCAVVGGSFIEGIGGHNILEPNACGIYAFYGPYMFAQKDFVQLSQKEKLGSSVSIDVLSADLLAYLKDQQQWRATIDRCNQFVSNQSGASESLLAALEDQAII